MSNLPAIEDYLWVGKGRSFTQTYESGILLKQTSLIVKIQTLVDTFKKYSEATSVVNIWNKRKKKNEVIYIFPEWLS